MTDISSGLTIDGHCAAGFEAVAETFDRNFAEANEVGASICVQIDGEIVVDLWGGLADPNTGRTWDRDTVGVVFSATKGAAATCAHLLVARGALELNRPIADYWPQFARKGKEHITVHDVLCHRSGVSAIRTPLPDGAYFDTDLIEDLIAAEAPFFPPGQRHGYAGVTFGFMIGALVRRVDGRSIGRYFAEELAEPLGLDFWIGTPPEVEGRIAPMILPAMDPATAAEFFLLVADPDSIPGLLFGNSGGYMTPGPRNFDSREGHAAQIASGSGVTNARGLAGLYGPLARPGLDHHGVRFAPGAVDWMSTAHSAGWDHTLRLNVRYGLGYLLATDNRWRPERQRDSFLVGPRAFGHSGFGGTVGFADPERRLAFGYTMNRMSAAGTISRRAQTLIDATYRSLGATGTESGAWR